MINPVTKKVDDLYYWLRKDRRAQTPDEVSVLVWLDCRIIDTAIYARSSFQFIEQQSCKMTLIDWKSRRIVQEKEFVGKPLPETFAVDEHGFPVYEEDVDSSVHRDDLLDWLFSYVE